jgi:hypothetical protein
MNNMKNCLLAAVILIWPTSSCVALQAAEETLLGQKVREALLLNCIESCPPVASRLLELGPAKSVSAIVLSFAVQNKDAKKGDGTPAYPTLIDAVFALGKLKETTGLPLLRELIMREGVSPEVEIYALQSIGEIDPDGNKGVLLRALKSQEFPVRRAAAEALSKTNDASVLTELEVVASQEKSRGQSGVIQVLADAMRARMSAVVK